jgi:glycosyltransferase involved in cell wall biosynthesis
MKILEINKFNYVQGGADRHFLDLVNLLRTKGHEVAVFSMESPKNEFSPWKKYFVSYVGYGKNDTFWQKAAGVGRMFYSFEAKKKMKQLLDDFQPEVAHIHNIYHQISPSILGEIKKRKIPVVMTVHDYKLICPNYLLQCNGKIWDDRAENRYVEFIKNKCFKDSYSKSLLVVMEFCWHKYRDSYDKNIDRYIVPSLFVKTKLIAAGFRREKIEVQPLFIREPDYCEIGKIEIKEKYAIHFGRLSKEKGVDKLIEIFRNFPDLKLYLAGNIEGDLEIPEDIPNIKHIGFLKSVELDRYVKNSLFVVSPSRLPETFGLIALEAIKNGKPFIGFDTGAYGEIIEDDREGYLCAHEEEMKDRIGLLSRDEGLRVLFSRQALEKAKKFNSDDYHTRIMDIFFQCVKTT